MRRVVVVVVVAVGTLRALRASAALGLLDKVDKPRLVVAYSLKRKRAKIPSMGRNNETLHPSGFPLHYRFAGLG